ncbi:MAG: zinc ABC transporter substrate-binding protein [Oscillospiraceae bacterium]|nr:zinc ABC transporter substrate-binding protein [Oscillospiraceae bacterium]
MRRICALFCALLLLAGCSAHVPEQDDTFTITATTYPMYLFVRTVTRGIDNVEVERLDTGSVSCLHDYTLSVSDMKKIERADVIVINGAGLEDFMSDALAASDATIIDCSEGMALMYDEESQPDPHYWMDPARVKIALETLSMAFIPLLPEDVDICMDNATTARQIMDACMETCFTYLESANVSIPGVITFHDGFRYFTQAFQLPLIAAIEEEPGSEASAAEISEISHMILHNNIPVVFTEANGSDATANAIARETGCSVAQLSMIMDGPEPDPADINFIMPYYNAQVRNIVTLINGFLQEEAIVLP